MATPDHTPHGRGYSSGLHYFHHENDCEQSCAEDTATYIKFGLFSNTAQPDQSPLAARLVKSQYINTLEDLFEISLTDDDIRLIPDELVDEKSFITVFDSQPFQSGHVLAYAKIARNITDRVNINDFSQAIAS